MEYSLEARRKNGPTCMYDYIKELVKNSYECQINIIDIDEGVPYESSVGYITKLFSTINEASIIYAGSHIKDRESLEHAVLHKFKSVEELIGYYESTKTSNEFCILGIKMSSEIRVHRPIYISDVEISKFKYISKGESISKSLAKLWIQYERNNKGE